MAKAQATMTVTVPSTCYYKGTKITIKLVDTKTKKALANEKIAITIGTTKATVTTNTNGVATYNVALVPKSYNSKFVLSSNNYNSNSPTKVIKIVKATSVTLAPTALSTTYNSKKVFQVKVYKGSVLFVGAKVKLKVYTGKKYKTVTITTGTNGIAQYKDASVLSVAKHKVSVSCGESTSYMTATAKTSYITITKAPTTVSAPKVTNKYKKSAYFKVTIKMKSTGYTVPAGVAVKIKVYTGKKYKTYTVKTNSKGVAQLNTNSLSKGTHKVVISSGHIYYTISKSGNLIVIK